MFVAGESSCTAPQKITTKILTSLIEKVKVTRRLEVEWSLKGKVKRCSSISIPVNKRQIVLNNIAENHESLNNVPHDETYYRSRLCQESLNDPETWGQDTMVPWYRLIADWHFWSRVLCANKIFYLLSLISNRHLSTFQMLSIHAQEYMNIGHIEGYVVSWKRGFRITSCA